MARIARIVIPGWPHHVTQRGNHRQTVFYSDHDREVYLELLAKYKDIHRVTFVGFSLMSNHDHEIPVPEFKDSLAKAIGRTHNDYSRWLNIQCNQTGHLWQARFFSCPVDADSLADVLAYVELNPVRAGIVSRPEEWKWSSACAHLTGVDNTGLLDMEWWSKHFSPKSWAEFLDLKLRDKDLLHRIRTATQTGKPIGSEDSIRKIEEALGRNLRLRKRVADELLSIP